MTGFTIESVHDIQGELFLAIVNYCLPEFIPGRYKNTGKPNNPSIGEDDGLR